VTSGRFIISPEIRRGARRIVRELLICVVLPSALLVTGELAAQSVDQSQQSQQSQAKQSTDEQIVADINSRLSTSGLPNPLNFNVFVHGGVVTLRGAVPTAQERQQAEAFIKGVPGIKSVDDQLTIGQSDNADAAASAPSGEQAGNQNPEDQGQADQAQGPQEHAPGVPPPPPSDPYGPPPADADNGAMQNGPAANRSEQYPGRFPQPMVTIPTGMPVHVMMLDNIDSKLTKPGTHFRAVVVQDVILPNGATALPRGAYVEGTVIDSRGPGHLKGHPKIALQLLHAQIGDAGYPLSSYMWDRRGPGKGGQTTGNVVGGAAGGAIIGGAVGGGGTALLGAVLGGFGGAGLSALSGGARLVVPAESVLTFYLNAPVTVREATVNEMRSLDGNVPPPPGGYGRGPGPYSPAGYPPPYPPGPPGGYPY
jgi:hypothetical protein